MKFFKIKLLIVFVLLSLKLQAQSNWELFKSQSAGVLPANCKSKRSAMLFVWVQSIEQEWHT